MDSETAHFIDQLVDSMRNLRGAIIDHMPPDAQGHIADEQVRLMDLARRFQERVWGP